MRREFNPHQSFLVHQHGRRFIVLYYGNRDVTPACSVTMYFSPLLKFLYSDGNTR